LGLLGAFSFYPGKNLGALGEAGGITTNDKQLSERIQVLRDHGQHRKYYHSRVGWNARMDGIQGAVLSIKLKHLDVSNVRRHAHGLLYDQLLADMSEVITPFEAPHNRHVYHVYAIRVQERNQILQALADKGISCAIHYPIPVHLQEAYRFLGYDEGSFPVAERCAEEFLSLPMYPELSKEQVRAVVTELQSCISGQKPQSSCVRS
jgi:dTDP-4-amino-4,6-dideoxygalactose transaminase